MKRKGVYNGTGYWVVQLGASAFFTVFLIVAGVVIMVAPSDTRSGEDISGAGLLMLIFGIVFAVVFTVMLRRFISMSREQRAVYAWAVMQQHSTRRDMHPVNPGRVGSDLSMLSVAKRAKRGELTAAEIEALQRLRPDVPYPGTLPPARDA